MEVYGLEEVVHCLVLHVKRALHMSRVDGRSQLPQSGIDRQSDIDCGLAHGPSFSELGTFQLQGSDVVAWAGHSKVVKHMPPGKLTHASTIKTRTAVFLIL